MPNEIVRAKLEGFTSSLNSDTPDNIEYLPAGEHIACCSLNGKPFKLKINITEETAKVLAASLEKVLADYAAGKCSRPFIDFDHRGERAAAIPQEIFWDNGVRLKLEWTAAGKAAVDGKEYSYFSPEFLFNKDTGEVLGVNDIGAIGALCNTPAFQAIEKISATQNINQGDNMPTEEDMKKKDERIAELEASIAEKDKELEAIKAQLEEKEKAVEASENEKKEVEEKLEAVRKTGIESTVDSLIAAGRAKAEGKDALVKAALASEDNGKAIFDSLPERVLGAKPKTGTPSGDDKGLNARDAIKAQFSK